MPNHYSNGAGQTVDNETGGDVTPMPETETTPQGRGFTQPSGQNLQTPQPQPSPRPQGGQSGVPTPTYKVYGTNELYTGMTVEVGGFLYSTVGGALEGDSMQLVSTATSNPVLTSAGRMAGEVGRRGTGRAISGAMRRVAGSAAGPMS